MSYFKAKMHQIRFRLGALHMGSSQRSTRPPNWIWGVLLRMERKGKEWEGMEGKRKKKEERGKGMEWKGREDEGCVIAFFLGGGGGRRCNRAFFVPVAWLFLSRAVAVLFSRSAREILAHCVVSQEIVVFVCLVMGEACEYHCGVSTVIALRTSDDWRWDGFACLINSAISLFSSLRSERLQLYTHIVA